MPSRKIARSTGSIRSGAKFSTTAAVWRHGGVFPQQEKSPRSGKSAASGKMEARGASRRMFENAGLLGNEEVGLFPDDAVWSVSHSLLNSFRKSALA